MRVLVVSGFLGAGKTTFIKELARRTGRDFVIYENEYGQADIDAKVLSQNDELSVWESTENCICCSGKQDFASSILTISNTIDPEYLVVEPTGVARLSSILDNVNQVSYERVSLLKPLVIVDGGAWSHQKERYPDIYLDQVRTAPVVVVSKVEQAVSGELAEIASWVHEINPEAEVIDAPWSELPDSWFEGLLNRDLDPSHVAVPPAHMRQAEDQFESLSLAGVALPSESHLLWLMDALTAGTFGEVVRAKGFLPCGSQWLRFDVVDRTWQVTGTEKPEDGQSLAVFIGPDVRRPWLREAFLPLVRDAVAAGNTEAAESDEHDLEHAHDHHHHHHDDEHHHEHEH